LAKTGHFPILDADFGKNGPFSDFRRGFWQKWAIFPFWTGILAKMGHFPILDGDFGKNGPFSHFGRGFWQKWAIFRL